MIATIGVLLMIIGLLYSMPGWHEELDEDGESRDGKPFPRRNFLHATATLSTFAWILGLLSMLWQHLASIVLVTAVEDTAYGTVKGNVSVAPLVLGWAAVVMTAVGTAGIHTLFLSIRSLDNLPPD